MVRVIAFSLAAAVLAGCSSSSRVGGVVPGWANTHTGAGEPGGSRAAVRAAPDTAPQAAAAPRAAVAPQAAQGEE
jgi:hypothetical protein